MVNKQRVTKIPAQRTLKHSHQVSTGNKPTLNRYGKGKGQCTQFTYQCKPMAAYQDGRREQGGILSRWLSTEGKSREPLKVDRNVTSSRRTLSRSRASTASPPSARPRASFNCCSRPRMRLRNSSFSSCVSRSVVSTVARRCPSTLASVSDATLACGQLGESAQTVG